MVQYAPLVFSRTAYVDFRPNFIAAPRVWNAQQRAKARDMVLAATDYADRLDEIPRFVMFSEEGHLVAGAVALARWFSDTLTHELALDANSTEVPRRRLFAFVGAIYKIDHHTPAVPPMDQEFYRKIYDETVGPRFLERLSAPNWQEATDTEFTEIELEAVSTDEALHFNAEHVYLYPRSDEASLWRKVAAGHGSPSLCTNVPPGRHKQFENFSIITRSDITAARSEPRTAPVKKLEPKLTSASKPRSVDPSHDIAAWDENQKKKHTRTRPIGRLAFLALAGAVSLVIVGLIVIWATRKP